MRISDMPISTTLSGGEYVPLYDPNQLDRDQRNRRIEVDYLKGVPGERGFPGLSAYEIWLNLGNVGIESDFINAITGQNGTNGTNGTNGASAYQSWLNTNHTGTEEDFVNSLKGLSAYQVWLQNGNSGTTTDFLNAIRGSQGYSAYDIWIRTGHVGTQTDFINAITGLSAYQLWLYSGKTGSLQDFLLDIKGDKGLKGDKGDKGDQGIQGNEGLIGSTWLKGITTPSNTIGKAGDYYLNTSTADIYGPKTDSSWGSIILNIKGPPGNNGLKGDKGDKGDQGLQGNTGAVGSTWRAGNAPPSNGLGVSGDYYLNTSTSDVYGPKTDVGWGNIILNIKGNKGSTTFNGIGIPNNGAGTDGDYYIDSATGDFYNKVAGSWGSPIFNATGPSGPAGADGTSVPNASTTVSGVSRLATNDDISQSTPGAVVVTASSMYNILLDLGSRLASSWVCFNGTPATPVIKENYNVSNIIKIQPGIYDIYFSRPMNNANYVWGGSVGGGSTTGGAPVIAGQNNFLTGNSGSAGGPGSVKTVNVFRVYSMSSYTSDLFEDSDDINVFTFGGLMGGTSPPIVITPSPLSISISPSNSSSLTKNTYNGAKTSTSTFTVSTVNGTGPYTYTLSAVSGTLDFSIDSNPTGIPPSVNTVNSSISINFTSSSAIDTVRTFSGVYNLTINDSSTPSKSATTQIQINHIYTSDGTGAGIGGCVMSNSYLNTNLIAKNAKVNDIVMGMDQDTREFRPMRITRVGLPEIQPCIRVTNTYGVTLSFSLSTPITLETTSIMATELTTEMRLATRIGETSTSFWDEIIKIEDIGLQEVIPISVENGQCFAAGELPDQYIYTHNMDKP